MKKHLGKLKKMKTIDKTGPEFFPNGKNLVNTFIK